MCTLLFGGLETPGEHSTLCTGQIEAFGILQHI